MQLNQGGTTQFAKVGDVDGGGHAIPVFVCSKCWQENAPCCTVQWRVFLYKSIGPLSVPLFILGYLIFFGARIG